MNHPLLQAIKERDGGFIRLVTAGNHGCALAQVMHSLGLEEKPEALSAVSPEVAANSVAALLWKDLAYGHEFMPWPKALAHGQAFVAEHDGDGATFYVNGEWDRYHQGSGCAYTPLSDATFSAVVMVVHPEFAACLLVEDED